MKRELILFLILFPFVFMLSSCFKDDEAVAPHPRGDVQEQTIPLGQGYEQQVFFKLSDNNIVLDINRYAWELSFGGAETDFHIRPNSARFMKVSATSSTDFEQNFNPNDYPQAFDASSGNPDSLVFQDWFLFEDNEFKSSNEVFLLHPGVDANGQDLPVWKLQFSWIDSTNVGMRYGLNLQEESFFAEIGLDTSRIYTGFSLERGQIAECEPPKGAWDLYFGQYSTMLYTNEGVPTPYLVTGTLINPLFLEGQHEQAWNFEQMNLELARETVLSKRPDIIGYDWKYYDLEAGTYTVYSDKVYLIKDGLGYYYSMRFVGFNGPQGQKGWPVFEFFAL